jgi:WD40 repeat protein
VLTAADAQPSPLALWDAETCARLTVGEAIDAPGAAAQALDVRALPDGVLAAAGLDDSRVRAMRREPDGSWRLVCEPVLHELAVTDLAISPDGSRIASAGEDRWGRVLIVAGCGGEHPQVADLTGHAERLRSVRFSPDGRYLVTASQDRTARVWTPDGTQVQLLAGHKNYVSVAEFSPDGRWILTASRDGTIKLWRAPLPGDPPAGEPFLVLTADLRGVPFATFSPDGRDIGAAYWRNTAQLWRIWAGAGDGTAPATLANIRATWGAEDADLVLLREAERFRRGNRLDDLATDSDAAE